MTALPVTALTFLGVLIVVLGLFAAGGVLIVAVGLAWLVGAARSGPPGVRRT